MASEARREARGTRHEKSAAGGWANLSASLTVRAITHPALASDLLRVAWRFRARGWYRRFPFLPLPPAEYVRWRMYTAYGDDDAIPSADDVVRYARWVGASAREESREAGGGRREAGK